MTAFSCQHTALFKAGHLNHPSHKCHIYSPRGRNNAFRRPFHRIASQRSVAKQEPSLNARPTWSPKCMLHQDMYEMATNLSGRRGVAQRLAIKTKRRKCRGRAQLSALQQTGGIRWRMLHRRQVGRCQETSIRYRRQRYMMVCYLGKSAEGAGLYTLR